MNSVHRMLKVIALQINSNVNCREKVMGDDKHKFRSQWKQKKPMLTLNNNYSVQMFSQTETTAMCN